MIYRLDMADNMSTILTLGVLGIGGYFFITQIYPMMKRGISEAFEEPYSSRAPPLIEERIIPATIIEDRIPDIVYEDRYPDIVYEDRYPDIINYPNIYPIIGTPPYCGPGRYWDGTKCKRMDCGPGLKWDDGECRVDCPDGWRYDDGICKPRNCDNDEYFDGRRCRELPKRPRPPRIEIDWDRDWGDRDRDRDRDTRPYKKKDVQCPPGYINDNGTCKRRSPDTERRFENNNTRDRWHRDREMEERLKNAVIPPSPETDRVKEIQDKAVQSFIDIWEY